MINILNKYTNSNPEQATWFAHTITHIIFNDLKAKKEYVQAIKTFFNPEIKSCIVRMSFDEKYALGMKNEYLYFMIEFGNQKMNEAGKKFEEVISDKDHSVFWIHNNEVLEFYPDNNIMSLLTKKLCII